MKKYLTASSNRGTTIILESVQEAIDLALSWKGEQWGYSMSYDPEKSVEACVKALNTGDPEFKKEVEEKVDALQGMVDELEPRFSQEHSGYELSEEEGVNAIPEALAQGDPLCIQKKKITPFKIKEGKGDGAWRILINTDVSWWGDPSDCCAIVGCLIILLQRYAPVEVWIQQGWLGNKKEDGVTLFKLDYPTGLDITALAFWITHRGKDIPFSYSVNKALGRKSHATSCRAEIQCDMMLRGDWMSRFHGKVDYWSISSMLYTEKMKWMALWVKETGLDIMEDKSDQGPQITDRP